MNIGSIRDGKSHPYFNIKIEKPLIPNGSQRFFAYYDHEV